MEELCAWCDGALVEGVLSAADAAAAAAVEAAERAEEGGAGGLTFGTFWSPREAWRAPRDAADAAAGALWAAAGEAFARAALGDAAAAAVAGAEWWVQEQDETEAPKGYHTDVDVRIDASGSSEARWPAVASVLYLSDCGGPTAVFAQGKPVLGEGLVPRIPSLAAACPPRRNRYLCFRGESYHGVLKAPVAWGWPPGDTRRTMLFNFWTSRPSAAGEPPASLPPAPSPGTEEPRAGAPPVRPPEAARADAPFSVHCMNWRRQELPAQVRGARVPVALAYDGPPEVPGTVDPDEWAFDLV